MEEEKLINEAKNGNKTSLNTLINENYNIVFRYTIKMTGDYPLAQDITQETLLKAILNLKRYTYKESKFSTWLIKIATNVYRDYLRKNKNLSEMKEDIESEKAGPEELTIEDSEIKGILDVLNSLSFEKRIVFILKHYYGYKYDEIAEIIGCPVGTVRSRLHNCINDIIKKLEERRII